MKEKPEENKNKRKNKIQRKPGDQNGRCGDQSWRMGKRDEGKRTEVCICKDTEIAGAVQGKIQCIPFLKNK